MKNIDISKTGFKYFKDNFLDINELHLKEFYEALDDQNLKIRGDNVSVIKSEKKYSNIMNLKQKILNLFKQNKIKNLIFEDIWVQKNSYTEYNPNELPNVPHIDKIRKFKVLIYLDDVDATNGAISFYGLDPDDMETFRQRLKPDYKKNKGNVLKNISKHECQKLTGPFGTTIFFDTNTPHFAGELKYKKSERKSLRFNFVKKKSFFSELF